MPGSRIAVNGSFRFVGPLDTHHDTPLGIIEILGIISMNKIL